MVTDTARRVREGLAELIRLVNDAATPTADLRAVLVECKAYGGQLAVLQADAAAGVAVRERHGDSGVGLLAQAAGLSRRDAASQVKIAKHLESLPSVRDAVESGYISVANAKVLTSATEKTSAEQVEQDLELLSQAAVLSPEQFVREAGRWAAQRQNDDGEELHRRQRARRRLSFWDGDDGMVHLRGELDPVTGAKVRKRFGLEAERLRRLDLHSPGGDKRSLNQRMADALETLSSHGSIYSKAESAAPGGRSRRGPSPDTASGSNGGGAARVRNRVTDAASLGGAAGGAAGLGGAAGGAAGLGGAASLGGAAGGAASLGGAADGVSQAGSGRCGCGARPSADITIVQHLSADGTNAFAEVAGGGVIPRSVLEEHFCNAVIKGVVFSCEGLPLWHSHTKRLATKAQMNALRARYGACGGCGADMWICQGHHIEPVSQGGRTDIDNLMLLCWRCHQKVHHHDWQVVPDGRGLYTIAPPDRSRHGPGRAPGSGRAPDAPAAHRRPPGNGPARPVSTQSPRRPAADDPASPVRPEDSQSVPLVRPEDSQSVPLVRPEDSQSVPLVRPEDSQSVPLVRPEDSQSVPLVRPEDSQSVPLVRPEDSQSVPLVRPEDSQSVPLVRPEDSQSVPLVRPEDSQSVPLVRPEDSQSVPLVRPENPQSEPLFVIA